MKFPPLTLLEIAQGMIACRTNSREMLEECETLRSNSRYARAYFLAHTACEELAKFFILELAGKRLAQGNPPAWKQFWRRFRSHDSKMAQLNVQLLYLLLTEEHMPQRDAIETVNELFLSYGLVIRNSGLYTEVGPTGAFRKPSDIDFDFVLPILRDTAMLALDVAERRGNSIDNIESHLRERPLEAAKEEALKTLQEIVALSMDAGVEKEELIRIVKSE